MLLSDGLIKAMRKIMDFFQSNLVHFGGSRVYHITVAAVSLVYCIVLPGSVIDWIGDHFTAQLFAVAMLAADSVIRIHTFGNSSILSSIDYAMSAIAVNLILFEIVFQSFTVIRLTMVLSIACALRAVVAVQHSLKDSVSGGKLRAFVIVSSTGDKRELDLCYLTPRIIVIVKNALSTPESQYLEQKHSSLLKSLAVPYTNEILSLSSLCSIVDSAVRHLFSNCAHLVSVNAPLGDTNPVLVLCCLLLRTSIVSTVAKATNYYTQHVYTFSPTAPLLCKSQLAQLRIFQSLAVGTTSSGAPSYITRLSVSQFDALTFANLLLSVVDIESGGNVLLRDLPGTVNSAGACIVYNVSTNVGPDTFFVFTDSNSGKRHFALYMNSKHHLVRAIASNSQYVFKTSTNDCDHYSEWMVGVGARIDIVATTDEHADKKKIADIERDLLLLPMNFPTHGGSSSV